MISYVVPLYIDDVFTGVLGMDIDFDSLSKIVADTNLYDTGYAYIVDEHAKVVYHKQEGEGTDLILHNNGEFADMARKLINDNNVDKELIPYTYQGVKKELAFRRLENGMRFVVTAPRSEIDAQANKMLIDVTFRTLVILIIVTVACILFTRKLVSPLQELTAVAKKVATGDLDVEIEHHSKDEVGTLADSFRLTILHLSKYFKSTQELAYNDALTSVRNTRAYGERVANINKKIKMESSSFSLAIFDLNNLKHTNDTYGHISGDLFIVSAARLLCEVFDHYCVYRIGGDEFVIFFEDTSEERCQQLLMKFKEAINAQNQTKRFQLANDLWVAWGLATYQEGSDKCVEDVFKRADQIMYMHKQEIKNKR